MNWLDRLLARPTSAARDERKQDELALQELHESFDKVQGRADRLTRELLRVNAELRARRLAKP